MRIGIEITPLTHAPTGVGYYTRNLVAALAASPNGPTLVGFASGVRPLDADAIPMPYRRLTLPTRALYMLWDAANRPRVDAFLGGVDVYHGVNYVLPPLKKARGVLTIHDLSFLRDPEWTSPKIVAPFSRAIKRHAQGADAVIACSEATKRDIVELLDVAPEGVHVIYEAADPLFRPVERTQAARQVFKEIGVGGPYLLFVGTVEPRKNIVGLLKAYAAAQVPQRLVIAGGMGWNSSHIPPYVERLGLSGRVVFTGYLRDRSLFPALYSAADALVFPSWYEGFGLTVLEAMACGCPVITSNAASLPEVGGDAALYATPADKAGFVRHIQHVAMDASLRQTMREKGLRQAGRFSWERCAEETLACYRSVL